MKLNLLAVAFLGAGTSASAAHVNKSLHSSSSSHLGGTKNDAMYATLTEEEFSALMWGDRVKEDIDNTQHHNEGCLAFTEYVAVVDAKAKIRADKVDELSELLGDKTKENEALKAWIAEVDAKAKIHADKVAELRELLADKTDENEALMAWLDRGFKAWVDDVDAKAKIQAGKEDELRELLADKMKENEALKARRAEVDAKAKIQADKEDELSELLADKMKENEDIRAFLLGCPVNKLLFELKYMCD